MYVPVFIIMQVTNALGLWYMANQTTGEERAGLDSFAVGLTDLRTSTDCVDHRLEVWRLYTYQFTHLSFYHVLCTCLTSFLGIPLERRHGCFRLFMLFNAGVLGGALSHSVTDIHRPFVGMEGGNCAIFGACFADLVLNWTTKSFRGCEIVAMVLMVAAAAVNDYMVGSFGPQFGGMIAGLLAGFMFCRSEVLARRCIALLRCFAAIVSFFFFVCCLLWTVQWPPRNMLETDTDAFCWTALVSNVALYQDQNWHCAYCGDLSCIARWSTQHRVVFNVSGCHP